MKRFVFPSACLFGLMASLCVACKSPTQKPAQDKDVQSEERVGFDIPPVHLLTDSLLPQYVDYKQDISHLGYQELRILRSYPYALHGYWFMEADLNSFFINKTSGIMGFAKTRCTKPMKVNAHTPTPTTRSSSPLPRRPSSKG